MSDWIGPNCYRIEAYNDRKAAVALAHGKSANGTEVVIWSNDINKNDRWMFVYLGIGESGKEEYHVLNRNGGTYLTCSDGAKQAPLKGNVLTPWSARTRWCIIPTRNQTGTYWIVAAANPKMLLCTQGGGLENNKKLQVWEGNGSEKFAWWYLRLNEDAILQCPTRAPAPKP